MAISLASLSVDVPRYIRSAIEEIVDVFNTMKHDSLNNRCVGQRSSFSLNSLERRRLGVTESRRTVRHSGPIRLCVFAL